MSILEAAIGWVAPPVCVACGREGLVLCLACSTSEIVPYGEHCWLCNKVSPGGRTCIGCRSGSPRYVWITTSYNGVASELVKAYKFGHQRAVSTVLGELMHGTLNDFNSQADITKLDYLVVPIPSATSRKRQRGFDHSELLAKVLARKMGAIDASVLGRLGQSRQLGARRRDRLKQPKDNYFVRRSRVLKNQNVLLIDDVVTTGATIRAATKVLRRAGARRIDALVFAKKL